ncbi:hypothetical protein RM844_24480 [Streptomyces sp. DSM 44915]|uniref:Uncharacterized protein n=1 Tax=Streptomyces chisholmiae TaxID=3075540 RepID=A0ABU2JXF5_9ACTN|nr:hypothetical protein [Streptomyces sp. DSM 44915]MDT0269443.1 hypothetical protein [Streptomyces sp. DSM 44915]
MSVDRMIRLPGVERIRTLDPNNHLHCRKAQYLSYAGSRTPWSDLLMYGALGSTAAVHRHCYLRGGDRWSYETPYVTDADLRLLGFEVSSVGTVDLPRFVAGLPELLAAGQPAFFYAPRYHFPHWVEFMRRTGTIPEEYRLLHSFLVCGVSGEDVLLVDNTADDHEYFPLAVGWDVLRDGHAREPERWFTGCATVRQVGEPDRDGFEAGYRAFLAGFRDGFELYDVVGDGLVVERAAHGAAAYRAPGVNSLALLAGSRSLFCRFLSHTAHGEPVRAAYARIARLAVGLTDRVQAFLAGLSALSADQIRRGLAHLRLLEQRAARLLIDEGAALPQILPAVVSGR